VNITSLPPEAHDCDVYIRKEQIPTLLLSDYKDTSTQSNFVFSIPHPMATTWYLGFWGYKQCNYKFRLTTVDGMCTAQCSNHGVCVSNICRCSAGFVGDYCENKTAPLVNYEIASGRVAPSTWNYYICCGQLSNQHYYFCESKKSER